MKNWRNGKMRYIRWVNGYGVFADVTIPIKIGGRPHSEYCRKLRRKLRAAHKR